MNGNSTIARRKRLERQVLVQQQREPEAEAELDDARDDRIEDRVEQREPRDFVAPEELVVLESDPFAAAADLRVGEAEPGAEAERIREEQQQQHRRRQQEQEAEGVAVVLERGRSSADKGSVFANQRRVRDRASRDATSAARGVDAMRCTGRDVIPCSSAPPASAPARRLPSASSSPTPPPPPC